MAQCMDGPWYAEFFDAQGEENADHGWFVVNEDTGRTDGAGPYGSEQAAESAADRLNSR